ncbi:MAG TPA: hypothetical protein VGL97_09865 [Bryobacteraceae bacterium]
MRSAAILGALLLLPSCAVIVCSEDLPAGVLQTARVMHANRDLLKSLPLYTCLETISRSSAQNQRRKPKRADVVQVDVGVGANQEMYSWPGESTFSPQDLAALVGHGFLSTGLFESLAANLFVLGHGIVKPAAEERLNGTPALHFTYTVPSLESRSLINWDGQQGLLGEEGDFWVDKTSHLLLRLNIRASAIPPNVPLKTLNSSIDYQFLTLNGRPTLLPKEARVIAVESNGALLEDDEAFSHCHMFEAESRLAASVENLEKALTRYESQRGILPAGLTLRISLQTSVRADRARIGDAVEARLDRPLEISPDLAAPKGSLLKGHVREFSELADPPGTLVIGLEFDELEWPQHAYSFLAEISDMQQIAGLSDTIYRNSSSRWNSPAGPVSSMSTELFLPPNIPGTATFFLRNNRELPAGFQMTWRTRALIHP